MARTYVTTNILLLGVFIWILVEICAVEKDGTGMYFMYANPPPSAASLRGRRFYLADGMKPQSSA